MIIAFFIDFHVGSKIGILLNSLGLFNPVEIKFYNNIKGLNTVRIKPF